MLKFFYVPELIFIFRVLKHEALGVVKAELA